MAIITINQDNIVNSLVTALTGIGCANSHSVTVGTDKYVIADKPAGWPCKAKLVFKISNASAMTVNMCDSIVEGTGVMTGAVEMAGVNTGNNGFNWVSNSAIQMCIYSVGATLWMFQYGTATTRYYMLSYIAEFDGANELLVIAATDGNSNPNPQGTSGLARYTTAIVDSNSSCNMAGMQILCCDNVVRCTDMYFTWNNLYRAAIPNLVNSNISGVGVLALFGADSYMRLTHATLNIAVKVV